MSDEDEREIRVQEIVNWFATRDEDVILLQEVWSFHEVTRWYVKSWILVLYYDGRNYW